MAKATQSGKQRDKTTWASQATQKNWATQLNRDKATIQAMEIPFTPIDEKILVKPMEPIYLKREETVFKASQGKSNKPHNKKSLKEIEKGEETETETVTKDVKANVRRGVVLAVPKQTINSKQSSPIEIGDVIVYHEKPTVFQFDLYRDSVLINTYDILGKWDITKQKDNDIYNRTYPESNKE